MIRLVSTVAPFHFEDFSGTQFERLVFAYHVRTEPRYSFEWYGQVGKDKGRDVLGVGTCADTEGKVLGIACANWKTLTKAKAIKDFNEMLSSPTGKPDKVRFITGGKVSASLRDTIKHYCVSKGVHAVEVWSGSELEEHLRSRAESLLKRFVSGEHFPDSALELMRIGQTLPPVADSETLELMARAFDRPAFKDEIRRESSLPAFRQAIEDTICLLNTGVWKTRDGVEIKLMASKYQVQDKRIQGLLMDVVNLLRNLRTCFDDGIRAGTICGCRCGEPTCCIFFFEDQVADDLEHLRHQALETFDQARLLSLR